MTNENAKQNQLSQLLKELAKALDLPPSRREEIEKKYKAVSDWLGREDESLHIYAPKIYPHGSFRLGTVVPPLEGDEVDLDFVCELLRGAGANPRQVKALVGERLKENGRYTDILIEKNRCWRINYAGDFHMDIMPALPATQTGGGLLKVPDKELATWVPSNPGGYARWFDNAMVPVRRQIRLERKASVEELPDRKIKTPLQRAIQILKRHRDIRFANEPKNRPSSIVLTTLAAKAYRQESELFAALRNVVNGMEQEIEYAPITGLPIVPNPVNREENLAEKWQLHPERFAHFKSWLVVVRTDLDALLRMDGLHDRSDLLNERFGKRFAESAVTQYAEFLGRTKDSRKFTFSGGLLIPKTGPEKSVRPNTFYGS